MTFHVASTLRAFGALCVLPAYFCLYVWVCVIAWKMCTEQTSEAASILSHSKMLGNVYTENRTLGKSVVDEKLSESSTLCTESLTYKTNAKWRDFWEYWILLSILAATVKWSAREKERERETVRDAIHTKCFKMNEWQKCHTYKKPLLLTREKRGYITLREKFSMPLWVQLRRLLRMPSDISWKLKTEQQHQQQRPNGIHTHKIQTSNTKIRSYTDRDNRPNRTDPAAPLQFLNEMR